MLTAKIDVTKIDKAHIFTGKKGKYIDITLIENKHGEDEFGNLGFVVQNISKEARAAGEKGPILGNYKEIGQKRPTQPAQKPQTRREEPDQEEDIPF